jgi:hypothetical protein
VVPVELAGVAVLVGEAAEHREHLAAARFDGDDGELGVGTPGQTGPAGRLVHRPLGLSVEGGVDPQAPSLEGPAGEPVPQEAAHLEHEVGREVGGGVAHPRDVAVDELRLHHVAPTVVADPPAAGLQGLEPGRVA